MTGGDGDGEWIMIPNVNIIIYPILVIFLDSFLASTAIMKLHHGALTEANKKQILQLKATQHIISIIIVTIIICSTLLTNTATKWRR